MKTREKILRILILVFCVNIAISQRICDNTKQRINLSNGISVDVYKERGADAYYYVPNRLQLSMVKGKKQYSFQEFNRGGNNAANEAIFHCLVTWGLTKNQLSELRKCIKEKYGDKAVLSGAVTLRPSSNSIAFSNTPIGNILKQSLKGKGLLPTFSNSKMALSFTIKGNDVATIKNAIKNPQNFQNTSITLSYTNDAYTCGSPISTKLVKTKKVIGQLKKWF